MMNKRAFWLAILIISLFLSLFSFFSTIGFLCCYIWVWGGTIFGVLLYRLFSKGNPSLSIKQGVSLGAVSGGLGAFLGIFVGIPILWLSFFALTRSPPDPFTIDWKTYSQGVIVSFITYTIFGMVGGFIGTAVIWKEKVPIDIQEHDGYSKDSMSGDHPIPSQTDISKKLKRRNQVILTMIIGGIAGMVLPMLVVIEKIKACNYNEYSQISGVVCLLPFVIFGAFGAGLGGVIGNLIKGWSMERMESKKASLLGSSIGLIIAVVIAVIVSIVPAFMLAFPDC